MSKSLQGKETSLPLQVADVAQTAKICLYQIKIPMTATIKDVALSTLLYEDSERTTITTPLTNHCFLLKKQPIQWNIFYPLNLPTVTAVRDCVNF